MQLAKSVYAVTNERAFSRDFGLRDQIRPTAVSVMSNMAEGFEGGGDVELRRFLLISKGSAGEVRAQLYVALDAGMIDKVQFDSLYKLSIDVASLLAGLIRYLNKAAASHPMTSNLSLTFDLCQSICDLLAQRPRPSTSYNRV